MAKHNHSTNITESVRLSAMAIGADENRPIIGRLGGTFESVRSVSSILDNESPIVQEGTSLLRAGASKAPTGSPPFQVWIVPALTCAAAYAFYNIFIKKGSASIHPILGGVILQCVAALLGTVLICSIVTIGNASSQLHYDKNGLLWSVAAGVAVGIAEMLSFTVAGMGVQATQFIPIIIGGSVMFGAILGVITLGEKMLLHGWSGVVLLVTGIALVATDPGEKVVEAVAGSIVAAPPLAIWIGPALLCAAAYAFYNIFIKKGSASINPILGGVILQFVAAIFGSILLGVLVLKDGKSVIRYDMDGLLWSCMAGLSVGAAELLSFCVSGMGVQATQSIPIIIGGSVMFGAVLGVVMLGEELMLQGWIGAALLMTGIGFVATDPGEKVAGH